MTKLTYRTIENNYEYEIPKIKGSRFLTYLFPCGDKEKAEAQYKVALKAVQKAAKKGVIKDNTCSRKKSQLDKALNKLK